MCGRLTYLLVRYFTLPLTSVGDMQAMHRKTLDLLLNTSIRKDLQNCSFYYLLINTDAVDIYGYKIEINH